MRRSHSRVSFPLIVLVLLLAAPLFSSGNSSSASACVQSIAILTGNISDQNDAVVSHARVTARNSATGFERTTITDNHGTYQFPALPIGYYRLEINAAGFRAEIVEQINVEVGRIVVQDFHLEIGDVSQSVVVPADASLIELTTTAVGSFGQPGRVVGSATFGRIINTRFPTGDSGSSRQLQFA